MKQATNADVFKYSVFVFLQQMRNLNATPTNDQIVRLGLAIDNGVQFSIDQSETVTFVFSDGSRATVHAQTTH